jgi:hypothetical protein
MVMSMMLVTAGFGAPQLLIALACGTQARRIFRRRTSPAASAEPRPSNGASTGIVPGDQTACEKALWVYGVRASLFC